MESQTSDKASTVVFLKWLFSSKYGCIKLQDDSGKNFYIDSESISDEIPQAKEIYFSPITLRRGDHDSLDVLALWVNIDSGGSDRINEFPLDPSCIANSENGIALYWKFKKDQVGELPSIGEVEPYLKKIADWFEGEANTDQLLRLPERFNLSECEYGLTDFDFLFSQEEIESPEESLTESPEIVEDNLPEDIPTEQLPPETETLSSEQVESYPKEQPTEKEANEDTSGLGGWIKLHRKIIDNPIFKNSFTYHLFSYLLLRANHKPQRFLFNGKEIAIGRGQFITGIEQISHKTRITRWRVREGLRTLKNLNMIARKTTNQFSIITICNYDQYQSTNYEKPQAEPQAEPQKSDRPTAIKPQSNRNQTAANKNDKNVKNNIGRSKRETDPRVKEFLDYWEETFQKETGQPYVFSFGKDGKLVKGLLQVHSLEILQDTVRLFFKDEQCKRRGLIIGIFYQEVNRLLSLKAMDPLEQAKRRLLKKDGLN